MTKTNKVARPFAKVHAERSGYGRGKWERPQQPFVPVTPRPISAKVRQQVEERKASMFYGASDTDQAAKEAKAKRDAAPGTADNKSSKPLPSTVRDEKRKHKVEVPDLVQGLKKFTFTNNNDED